MRDDFDWGPISKEGIDLLHQEVFLRRMYEAFDEVKEGDIVIDFGATTGDFVCSILDKKPLHVYALEPSEQLFSYLVRNTKGYPVTNINQAIADKDDYVICPGVCHSDSKIVSGITFQSFITLGAIDHINFLKTDCEGGEYYIFTDENMNFLLNNVDVIVGEWHLSTPELKEKFRNFRDKYLVQFNYEIRDISGKVDIKSGVFTEEFVKYYTEIFIYLRGKK